MGLFRGGECEKWGFGMSRFWVFFKSGGNVGLCFAEGCSKSVCFLGRENVISCFCGAVRYFVEVFF